MIADAARAGDCPTRVELRRESAGLHVIVLAPAAEPEEVGWRVDVAGGGKEAQLIRQLVRPGKAANIAGRVQRQIEEGDGGSAEKQELIIAVLERHCRSTQRHR